MTIPTRKRAAVPKPALSGSGGALLRAWFASKGWTPWAFQAQTWDAFARGSSGLVQVPTGAGKTHAAFGAALIDLADTLLARRKSGSKPTEPFLHTLYITPLRAVTRDIAQAIREPAEFVAKQLKTTILIESRTGDTKQSVRAKQRERLPHVLLTTPESLCLMLSRDNASALFAGLTCIIADEWHDLLTSKRGTMTELALARLRRWSPALRAWALSATIPNAHAALRVLMGSSAPEHRGTVIRAEVDRPVTIKSLIPSDLSRLPWAGHLGLSMLDDVLECLDTERPTLIFVNTRSQAERWFHAVTFRKPEWLPLMALHHGSLDKLERERVEKGLKEGTIRFVVATSSLDLGVDFSPVQRVIQIGSPKGIARIVQRAGRANHRMGGASIVECVPTHALELIEAAAARDAFERGELEDRVPYAMPLDVLAQHIVTCALGGGFTPDALYDEVRDAWSYRGLSREDFDWTLRLVHDGGVLSHYPQFRKVAPDAAGIFRVGNPRIAQMHRLNLGTITGDASLAIRYASGKRLGTIDEGFITGLHTGQKFVFAGKVLEFIDIRGLTVLVRPAKGTTSNTPLWAGTRLPISESLSSAMRRSLEAAAALLARGVLTQSASPSIPPEFIASRRLLESQASLSIIPAAHQTLCELTTTREGTHLFLFPFEGRLVHAGLAALLALRFARLRKGTFSFAVNDYGFEILSPVAYPFADLLTPARFTRENLADDIASSVNMSQLARLAFREVARIAGLVFQNFPGARKTGGQLQASSGLMFDVLTDFDPGSLLLDQARREVMERHFEHARFARSLDRLGGSELIFRHTPLLTPLAFPLVVERSAAKVSNETIAERLAQMDTAWTAVRTVQR